MGERTNRAPSTEPDVSGTRPASLSDLHLTVAAVARRLGVAPSTLRTWDRRYGLGPGEHTAGSHRRYDGRDVARLEMMQQALLRGASPAEGARIALAVDPDDAPSQPGSEDVPVESPEHGGADLVAVPVPAHTVGSVLRLPGADPRARQLARAVLALDSRGAQQLLLEQVHQHGMTPTWDVVVRPVLVAVAQRWRYSGAGIEVEHLLSEVITAVTARVLVEAPAPVSPRTVLLGSMPGDHHTLPSRVLAAELATRRVATSMMGADLPIDALSSAITRIAPGAVFLWSQLPATAVVDGLTTLPRTRPRTRCFVGGPGWSHVTLPPVATALGSLADAADALAAAAGA